MLTCNMRNEFVAVRVYQAVKNPATTDEFPAGFSFMPEQTMRMHPGVLPSQLINIHKVCEKYLTRVRLFTQSSPPFHLLRKFISHVLQF